MSNTNQEDFILIRYLRVNSQHRVLVMVAISIFAIISTPIAAYYLWFIITPSVWGWGFNTPTVIWWKTALAAFACLYIVIGGLLPAGLFALIPEIFKLYIEESERDKRLDHREAIRGTNSKKVFVVHGHDDGTKEKVSRFLESLKLEAVILHEQISTGQTIIEKFENHASQAGFAIILLTPDDYGYPKDIPEKKSLRARQNVVLELGYFSALLGRNRIFVLMKDSIEVPSDFLGVVYTPLDQGGAWKFTLAKEMKSVGMELNLEELLS